jgi:hypothetical protein
MKYLKKFNEELRPQTYRNAARKLKKLGHDGRAKELEDWSSIKERELELEKWKQNIDELSKFGKFKINLVNTETGEKLTEEFYISLHIDRDAFDDSLDAMVEDGEGHFWIAIGLIPTTKEVLDKCVEMLPDPDMGNGFIWAMSMTLDFVIESDTMRMTKYELHNYDESISGDVSFADRSSANRFKILLKKMFSQPDFNYPSGYRDFQYFYEMFYNVFGAQFGLSSDFGFTPEMISDFINTLSPNEMYKSI